MLFALINIRDAFGLLKEFFLPFNRAISVQGFEVQNFHYHIYFLLQFLLILLFLKNSQVLQAKTKQWMRWIEWLWWLSELRREHQSPEASNLTQVVEKTLTWGNLIKTITPCLCFSGVAIVGKGCWDDGAIGRWKFTYQMIWIVLKFLPKSSVKFRNVTFMYGIHKSLYNVLFAFFSVFLSDLFSFFSDLFYKNSAFILQLCYTTL